MSLDIKKMIGESFLDIANAMETGTFGLQMPWKQGHLEKKYV